MTTELDITDTRHVQDVTRWLTLIEAHERLKAVPEHQKLPGFGLALAQIEIATAEAKAECITENLKLCAKSGLDIATIKSVGLRAGGPKGRMYLEVEMMDLADLGGGS